jgi:hypothetical protein
MSNTLSGALYRCCCLPAECMDTKPISAHTTSSSSATCSCVRSRSKRCRHSSTRRQSKARLFKPSRILRGAQLGLRCRDQIRIHHVQSCAWRRPSSGTDQGAKGASNGRSAQPADRASEGSDRRGRLAGFDQLRSSGGTGFQVDRCGCEETGTYGWCARSTAASSTPRSAIAPIDPFG